MSWYWIVFFMTMTVSIPIVVGLVRFPKLDKANRYFVLLLLAIMITEVAAHFYRVYFGNNMIVFNAYTVVSAVLIGHYVYSLNKDKKLLYLFYLVALFSIGETIAGGPGTLSNYSITVLSVVTIVVLGYLFYQMATLQLDTASMVINGGLIFYFMSNFLYFSTSGNLLKTDDMEYLLAFGIIKSITNVACYGWYAIGLWRPFI